MSLDIGGAIKNGISNVASKTGAIFITTLTLIYLMYDVALDTVLAGLGEPQVSELAITSSLGLGLSLLGVYIISLVYLMLVLLRAFAAEETSSVPEELYKNKILFPAVNLVAGSILFTIAVGLGLLALIIPGLFLLVVLYFYSFEIAVQNKNFFQAFKGSYGLTKGSRVELFALGVTVFLLMFVIGILTMPIMFAAELGGTAVTLAALTVYNAVLATTLVATFSIAAQAYNQLLEMKG